ncbi:uncharacterized protein B0H18DRAFT_995071 [Fomitopsis serialis]|uniref:uncharacterized protein n=1 Tax=Fomitopsis serialis TaxID=139415 RepID=UPI002007DC5F|nr:uncharacterized protein B0H18DRAFT_995071 [Neoantrodia serialis]KAH9930062.1 hypothetical protein B0H18DRAFT_995071 [Neoantrodia serialis]
MEQLEVRTGDFEDASLVKNAYRVHEISRPVPSDLDVPDVASNLNLGLLAPSPPCPTPLARRSSNLVPIYAPSACGRQVSPSPSLTHTPDPFGAFAESYFADEPKGSVVHANAVPDLYNFDVYAPSSTPPRRQRTRENRETREVNATERPTFVSSVLQVPTGQQDTTHPAARQGLDEIACKVPAENRIEDPPKLRRLLLPAAYALSCSLSTSR